MCARGCVIVGSSVPIGGNIVGAIGGLIGGIMYFVFTEVWKPAGISIKDRTKEAVYDIVR